MYLENINGPDDLKGLNAKELKILADEVRDAIIDKVSNAGGHIGSNLGVVELTVALHYVFSSPVDKIVWDVSHQCYAHKILTGRKSSFLEAEKYRDVSGFTNFKESPHDIFTIGHTSTSVSQALGLAKARDALGKKENIVAVIGDGALGGGEALEAINSLGEYDGNFILIINDNDQSIAENHGGLYKHLYQLRKTKGLCDNNLFECLGLQYRYLDDGHNTDSLISLLKDVKNINCPVVLHIHTIKGKGLAFAQEHKEDWHSGAPFHKEDGSPKNGTPVYDSTIYDSLDNLLLNDTGSVVLTAGTPRAMGFIAERRDKHAPGKRFVDVGIAEQNAMGLTSGVAKYGARAVFGVYASFIQRAYDQLWHDVCLNEAPATILVLLPGAYGMKSNTHLGLSDIQLMTHIPNLVYLSPYSKEEYLQMFRYATTQNEHPVAIRVPCRIIESGTPDTTDYSLINKAHVLKKGRKIAIIAVGSLIPKALETAEEFRKLTGEEITVINPKFLTGLDEDLLEKLKDDHELVITWEDGFLWGGYGQNIAAFYGDGSMKVRCFGISKAFHSDFNTEELLKENGISIENALKIMLELK